MQVVLAVVLTWHSPAPSRFHVSLNASLWRPSHAEVAVLVSSLTRATVEADHAGRSSTTPLTTSLGHWVKTKSCPKYLSGVIRPVLTLDYSGSFQRDAIVVAGAVGTTSQCLSGLASSGCATWPFLLPHPFYHFCGCCCCQTIHQDQERTAYPTTNTNHRRLYYYSKV